MKLYNVVISASLALLFGQSALAQTAETPPAAAAAAPAGAFSDDDIQKYAVALVAVNKIQADTVMPAADKPAKMAATVGQSGLDIPKFNAMTQAMQTDKALQARIQTAAAAVPR